MKDVLLQILQSIIIVAVPILTKYACSFLAAKIAAAKKKTTDDHAAVLLDMAYEAIETAVTYVNQTYVDALRKSDSFSPENQKEAFTLAYDAAIKIMSEESKEYIATMSGNFGEWMKTAIEAQVNKAKG